MAEIVNVNGVVKIIDDGGNEVAIEPSPFSPPMELTYDEITASFANGWTRYSDSLGVQVSKTNGIVTINGLVKGGAINVNSVVLVLPIEYRPSINIISIQITNSGQQRVDVHPTGDLQVNLLGDRTATTDWVSINFSFKALQP